MATVTYDMNKETKSWGITVGSGSSVTNDVLVEIEDTVTRNEAILALEEVITRIKESNDLLAN